MTIEQTVEIPAARKTAAEAPRFAPDAPGGGITGECPHCAAHRWAFHRENSEAAAARQETQDIIDGKIPHKAYTTRDEFWKDLDN